MTTWEYKKTGFISSESKLNDLGRSGWELVHASQEGFINSGVMLWKRSRER